MQARRSGGRRAAPPRPTLLVGDLEACHAAFDRLQQRVLELSLQQQAAVGDAAAAGSLDAWRDLVPRCRALRETLTSLRQLSHFTREVYECAADVCARAGDYPEALKALQQLVHLIYPALAAEEAALAAAEQQAAALQQPAAAAGAPAGPPPGLALHGRAVAANGGSSGSGGGSSSSSSSSSSRAAAPAAAPVPAWASDGDAEDEAWLTAAGGAAALDAAALAAALGRPPFRRWPEVAAALSLYFACVQQGSADRLDTLATLRRLPRPLLATTEVQAALRLRAALAAGDWVALFRERARAPPLVQLVAGAAAGAARERALVAMAMAYRNVAVAAACRWLALDTRGLMACLKVLADRGHVAAQRALEGLQLADAPAAADLVFKG